jgi:hypothetical protein
MLLVLTASLSSCLGDKTQDDYIRQRVSQERAKLEAIEGTYRGTLRAKDTGQPLGNFALDLHAQLDVQNSYDNLTSQPKAVAKGTLYYNGLNQSQVSFDKGYYDDNSKLLEIRVPITDASGTVRNVSLHASVSGDQLIGEIEEDTLRGFVATFELVKNGPASQSQNLVGGGNGRQTEISAGDETFIGTSPEEGPNVQYKMTIQYQEKGADQLFLNVFMPERSVSVTLDLNRFSLNFKKENALLDERRNTLTADTLWGLGSTQYYIKLKCTRSRAGTPAVQWDCRTIAGSWIHHFVLSAAPGA